ncbi:SLOG family protein [Microbacterium sp. 13-71-7]|uniref:SLOG family protein n=1 Tax=Microbacterium sp. 13-71-7 TaxID=1970399 RepID=UPI0025F41B05|nr:SLOG family protein [Microbacterium sp. 13-71-7]
MSAKDAAPYRVMVTGGRIYGTDPTHGAEQRTVMLNALRGARARANGRRMVLVHGAASGADAMAARLTEHSHNAEAEAWPALWRRAEPGLFPHNTDGPRVGNLPAYYRDEALFVASHPGRGNYDKRAGFARNEAMLASGVDEVLAFFAEGAANKGTQGAVNSARRLRIPVREYRA